jgi:hypothetical protein
MILLSRIPLVRGPCSPTLALRKGSLRQIVTLLESRIGSGSTGSTSSIFTSLSNTGGSLYTRGSKGSTGSWFCISLVSVCSAGGSSNWLGSFDLFDLVGTFGTVGSFNCDRGVVGGLDRSSGSYSGSCLARGSFDSFNSFNSASGVARRVGRGIVSSRVFELT